MPEPGLTAYERIEIAMRFTVPLLRDLQRELGEEAVLDGLRTRLQQRIDAALAAANTTRTVEARMARQAAGFEMFAAGDALDYEIIARQADRLDVDVHRCRYAALMASLDASDLGALLICGEDHVLVASEGVRLERTQTCMQGASHCDFRFRSVQD